MQQEKKSIVVLGNGPSLKGDIEALIRLVGNSNVDVCAVNDFALSEEFFQIRPCIYVLADPNYWNDCIADELKNRRMRLLDVLDQDVTWPMRVMLPYEARNKPVFKRMVSKFISFEYYNRTPVNGFNWVRFRLFDAGLGMPPPYNVLIAALTLSIADCYQKIFILGADHSWHEELSVIESGEVLVAQKHFYDNKADQVQVYKSESEAFTIGELFVRWGEVFKMYEVLALYANYKCVNIYNLSGRSYIDAFPKASLRALENL